MYLTFYTAVYRNKLQNSFSCKLICDNKIVDKQRRRGPIQFIKL